MRVARAEGRDRTHDGATPAALATFRRHKGLMARRAKTGFDEFFGQQMASPSFANAYRAGLKSMRWTNGDGR